MTIYSSCIALAAAMAFSWAAGGQSLPTGLRAGRGPCYLDSRAGRARPARILRSAPDLRRKSAGALARPLGLPIKDPAPMGRDPSLSKKSASWQTFSCKDDKIGSKG